MTNGVSIHDSMPQRKLAAELVKRVIELIHHEDEEIALAACEFVLRHGIVTAGAEKQAEVV